MPLWHSIRREVIDGTVEGLEQAALSALTAVVQALNRGSISSAVLQTTQNLVQMALNGLFYNDYLKPLKLSFDWLFLCV